MRWATYLGKSHWLKSKKQDPVGSSGMTCCNQETNNRIDRWTMEPVADCCSVCYRVWAKEHQQPIPDEHKGRKKYKCSL